MKINIGLELDDNQRGALADWLDNKATKRLVTRKEVVNFVDALVMGIIDSHAAIGLGRPTGFPRLPDEPTPAARVATEFEDCKDCGGLGCDACDDGKVMIVSGVVPTQAPGGPPSWESHPRLTLFATQIEAGLEAHGYKGTYQERSYRRGWTLETIGSNR